VAQVIIKVRRRFIDIYVGLPINMHDFWVLTKKLDYTYKIDIKGFLTWWKVVDKVFLLTILVIKDICCSFGSWCSTRKENNVPYFNFCITLWEIVYVETTLPYN
jgi:hypothetical protein